MIVPLSTIQQQPDGQPKMLVWPPNPIISDDNIALNVKKFVSESYNNLASIGDAKERKSKTFGGCDSKVAMDAGYAKISTLSL